MKHSRHLFTLLLLLCTTVATAHDFEVNGLYYNIWTSTSTKMEVEVTYKGNSFIDNTYSGNMTIPESVVYNGATYTVVRIGKNAFKSTSITSLTIPNSVTDIADEAFGSCSILTELYIENGSAYLSLGDNYYHEYGTGKGLFSDTKLKKVYIGRILSYYTNSWNGYSPFCNLTTLENVELGEGVNIDEYLFKGCTKLKSITIPEGTTSIGMHAFYGCKGLTDITIGKDVASIGEKAFYNCSNLSVINNHSSLEITAGSSNNGYVAYYASAVWNNISSVEDYIFTTQDSVCYLTKYTGNDTSITLPSSYNGQSYKIATKAFKDCKSLQQVTIPNGVTGIANNAFENCAELTRIRIGKDITSIGENAFLNCDSIKEVHINDISAWCNTSFANSYSNPLYYAQNLYLNGAKVTNLALPDGTTRIESYAFINCHDLIVVTIPNSVTFIGSMAFYGCNNLISVTIGSGVLNILENAFPSTVKKMIFMGNTPPRKNDDTIYEPSANVIYVSNSETYGYGKQYVRLSSIFEVNGVRYVPLNTKECDVIDSRYDDSATNISVDSIVVYGNRTMTVKNINDYSFYGNQYIKQAYVNNDGYVGSYAFWNCDSISGSVTVKNNGYIGSYAFYDCDSIVSLNVANNGEIATMAFSSCGNLATATIANNGHIGSHSFLNCASLTTATIANNGYIGDCSFMNCTSLTTATIENDGWVGESAFENSFTRCGDNSTLDVRSNGEIKTNAFKNCTNLISANIANDGNIGASAFYGCAGLTSATIENNGHIGVSAFENSFAQCGNDSKVDILNPSYIGESAFKGCTRLVTANLLNNGNVGDKAFQNCTSLAYLTLGENVDSLGNFAFDNCASLKEFSIPNHIPSMGEYCFRRCTGLKKMVIGTGIEVLQRGTFKNCTSLTDMSVGVNVKSIQNSVFNNCSSLPAIHIPQATKNVTDSVFFDCKRLSLVVFENRPDSIVLGSNGNDPMFSSCQLDSVYIGGRLTYTYKGYSPFYGNKYLRSVTYNDMETEIYAKEYMDCSNLQNVRLSNNTRKIGLSAFSNCTALPRITIPNSVTKMDGYTFAGCSSLKQAIIGEKTDAINENTFADCVSLIDIKLGANIGTVARRAFLNCSALPEITIPRATASIADSVFFNCQSLARFYAEDGDKTLTLGKNAKNADSGKIGDNCPLFIDCQLDSVYLGRNLSYNQTQEYGYSPFYFNKTLRAVVIGDKVKSVFPNEFYQCRNLKYVSVGNGVTSVGDWAFSSCVSLDHFSFGTNLETIGKEAFSDCTLVTKIVSTRNVPPVCGDQALADIDMWNCTVYVPDDYINAYMEADQWCDFWIESVVETYTLSYVIDGEVYASYEIEEGGEIILPETPVREGYLFNGWSEIPQTMPAENITITGSFIKNTFTVTYLVDNEVYATYEIEVGREIILPEAPVREGYLFSGWSEIPQTMPAEDITINGSFTLNTFAVTYVVDGNVYTTENAVPGSDIATLNAPAKRGYKFVGWRRENPETIDIASNADAMLYTNAPCTNSMYGDQFAGWHVLFDGNDATIFHSEYSDIDSKDGLDHYIRVDMGENNPVSFFTITYTNRNTNCYMDAPKTMIVEGSNEPDGEYTEIAGLVNLSSVNSYVYDSEILGNGNSYRYIRFRVVDTHYNRKAQGHPYFFISEFGMEKFTAPTVMPNEDVTLVAVYKKNDYDFVAGGIYYNFIDDKNVEVSHNKGTSIPDGTHYTGDVVIPQNVTYNGVTYNVSAIADNAFYNCTKLVSIDIPVSITSVGADAFNNCTGLEAVYISDLATWCRIDFLGVTHSTPLNYAHNLYLNGELLTELVVPSGITEIKKETFRGLSVTSVALPEGVTSIGKFAFNTCSLESIELPNSLTEIKWGAFSGCTELLSITIPAGVTSIEGCSFISCGSLVSVTSSSTTPATLGERVFQNIGNAATLYVPKSAKGAYEVTDGWNTFSNIVELVKEYKITYMVDGNVYASFMIEEGSEIIPIDAPDKNLHEFIEWSGLPDVMPSEDIVVEAIYEQIAVSISIGLYGTTVYSSQYALDFSEVEGLIAYAATGYNTITGEITMTRIKTSNDGVGIYLKGAPGTTYIVPIIDYSYNHSLNMLVGNLVKSTVNAVSDDGYYANYKYTIKSGDATPKFYQYSDNSSISAGKAYLQIPLSWLDGNPSRAIEIRFDEGATTGIDDIESENESLIYDLSGRAVKKASNGIYIINGKKTFVK